MVSSVARTNGAKRLEKPWPSWQKVVTQLIPNWPGTWWNLWVTPRTAWNFAHLERFSQTLAHFFFKPWLYRGFITETLTKSELPWNDWFCTHKGSDLGAQVRARSPGRSPGRGRALAHPSRISAPHRAFCALRVWLKQEADSATEETLLDPRRAEFVLCYSQKQPKLDI